MVDSLKHQRLYLLFKQLIDERDALLKRNKYLKTEMLKLIDDAVETNKSCLMLMQTTETLNEENDALYRKVANIRKGKKSD